MKRNYFIFDMDGVIMDSEPMHKEILKKVFGELGLDFSHSYHQTLVGMAAVPMWEKIRSDFSLETNARELMTFHKEIFFIEVASIDVPPVEGVVAFINRLKELDFTISLASSSSLKLINRFVDEIGVAPFFDYMVSGESIARSKPNPDIFLNVAAHFDEDPSKFIVIEDSYNGVTAAKAAGMTCIGFRNVNSGNQDLSAADLIVDSFSELTSEVIKKIAS
ncbi:HAD family phosphatase [Joostella atrarenae]|uniref:HAD family phosphatase n=1 Tax=Joostella atrarenae TaxID=679257 RepID=A0ABS9J3H0_9FLAO|nr:HAD family phosphatase [Joostella atrarenae]MCF8714949.1 HAD family phosphatase [Joostella atrarenae]